MADPKVTPPADDKGEKGTDPDKKPDKTSFDPTTIKDEDFGKIFEDDRLWKHDRFKKLNEKAKKADELAEAVKLQKQADLEKNKEWEKLANERKSENEKLQAQIKTGQINSAIQSEATKQGAVDTEAVLKLINQKSISVTEDGVEGVGEAVKKLLEEKPFLVGSNDTSLGKGTNPTEGGEGAPKKFKASQLKDVKFFRENQKEIMKSLALGLIQDDLSE